MPVKLKVSDQRHRMKANLACHRSKRTEEQCKRTIYGQPRMRINDRFSLRPPLLNNPADLKIRTRDKGEGAAGTLQSRAGQPPISQEITSDQHLSSSQPAAAMNPSIPLKCKLDKYSLKFITWNVDGLNDRAKKLAVETYL